MGRGRAFAGLGCYWARGGVLRAWMLVRMDARAGRFSAVAHATVVGPRAPHCQVVAALTGMLAAECRTGLMNVGASTFAASFSGDYINPVVIAGVPSHNGDEEIVIRVTSVDTITKTIQFCAWRSHQFLPSCYTQHRRRFALTVGCRVYLSRRCRLAKPPGRRHRLLSHVPPS